MELASCGYFCIFLFYHLLFFSYRLGKSSSKAYNQVVENEPHHARTSSLPPKDLESFAEDYRKLAIDCLKVLRIEMQLETIFHLQVRDISVSLPKKLIRWCIFIVLHEETVLTKYSLRPTIIVTLFHFGPSHNNCNTSFLP